MMSLGYVTPTPLGETPATSSTPVAKFIGQWKATPAINQEEALLEITLLIKSWLRCTCSASCLIYSSSISTDFSQHLVGDVLKFPLSMMEDWKFNLLKEIISAPEAEISISSPHPGARTLAQMNSVYLLIQTQREERKKKLVIRELKREIILGACSHPRLKKHWCIEAWKCLFTEVKCMSPAWNEQNKNWH